MKRTKPTKKKQQECKPPDNGLGGFMPNPPQNCPFPIFTVEGKTSSNLYYQDQGNCIRCSQKCLRFLEFNKEWGVYRKKQAKIYSELDRLNNKNNTDEEEQE